MSSGDIWQSMKCKMSIVPLREKAALDSLDEPMTQNVAFYGGVQSHVYPSFGIYSHTGDI